MKEKELQLVTFEQAKKLKLLGFDWETCMFYSPEGLIRVAYDTPGNTSANEYELACPTVALALKWMRDEKNLHGFCNRNAVGWYFEINKADNGTTIYWFNNYDREESDSYEDTERELLDAASTYLEEEQQ